MDFDSSYRITVSIGKIKLSLGSGEQLAEKVQMASKLLAKKEMAGKTVVVKATGDSDECNLGNKFFIIYSKGDIEVQLWDVDHAQFNDGKDYLLTIEHIDKIQTGGIKQYHIVCDAIEQ